jgi:hypothetical protein
MSRDDWWTDLDHTVLDCLARHGPMSAADVGRRLGMNERAATSVVSLLAQEGRLTLSRVAVPTDATRGRATASTALTRRSPPSGGQR